MPTVSKITRNRLTDAELFALSTWIVSNKESLDGVTRVGVATRATKALNMEVTPKHVDRALTATGIQLVQRAKPSGDVLVKNASHLAKQTFIAVALRDLMSNLGYSVPLYLDRIISNQPMEDIAAAYTAEAKGARQ